MTDDTASPTSLSHALVEFHQMFTRRSLRGMLSLVQERGLSMPQMATLFLLRAQGPHSVSAIAAHLGLSLAATSHLVERLVQQDLVTRQEDPDDRRQKRVTLAAGGIALVQEADRRSAEVLEPSLATLPSELQRRLAHVIDEVVQALDHDAHPQDVHTQNDR